MEKYKNKNMIYFQPDLTKKKKEKKPSVQQRVKFNLYVVVMSVCVTIHFIFFFLSWAK